MIAIESPRQPEIEELLRQGDEYMLSLYPPESCHLLSIDELEQPGVTVFVARLDGAAVGTAAIVDRGDCSAELKRMFVADAARGRGTGRLLLVEIEVYARNSGIRVIQLETGPLQHAALALYERCGYQLIPNFGKYVGDDNSVCYEKFL
ncbi:MAG TPA: GNAT family N-acetyltransferase [Galbitalea sp.]